MGCQTSITLTPTADFMGRSPTMTEESRKGLSRRQFLRSAALSGIAAGVAPTLIPSGVLAAPGRSGANDRIGIAVIDPGRQGGGLLGSAGKSPEARIVAMADVNLKRARAAAASYKAEVYQDYRKLLERKDVDAVITATPERSMTEMGQAQGRNRMLA